MARGINKVILIGNLGKDPETRSFANGGTVTNATLATSESWRDKEGSTQERTEWHNLVFHNKLGEIAAQYLRKGSKIYAEGSLRTRKWTDKEGRERYTTEIHVNDMQMLDGRNAGGSGGGGGGGAGYGDDFGGGSAPPPRNAARSGAPARATPETPPSDPFDDDDIPF